MATTNLNIATPESNTATATATASDQFHKLSHRWTLWAHLPHDTNWAASSYKKIYEFDTAEQAIAIFEVLPPKLVMNCMLFLMRSGIVPMWEDPQNRNGGCFSYKVANKEVNTAWKQLSYVTVGETISTNMNVVPIVNGITISPKKNFCIIKIWMANCNFQNAGIDIITNKLCISLNPYMWAYFSNNIFKPIYTNIIDRPYFRL